MQPDSGVDVSGPWVVERLFFGHSGEELPVLRHAESWLLAPLALRYVLEDARHGLGPGSLELHLRAISLLYRWAETDGGIGNIERFITAGGLFTVAQFKAIREFLELDWDAAGAFDLHRKGIYACEAPARSTSARTFNQRLGAIYRFLEWAMWPMNHGGVQVAEDQVELFLSRTYRQLKFKPTGEGQRHEPLQPIEIQLIRQAIGPDKFGRFPSDVFDVTTRLRNYAMFEMAFNYGCRIGELLTIQLAHVPRPEETHNVQITVPRQQNAPQDRRRSKRPRGKTLAREGVPPLDRGAFSRIRKYMTTPFPAGRLSRTVTSPYLFVTEAGVEMHVNTATEVIRKIGLYAARLAERYPELTDHQRERVIASLRDLRWHRLRHTWAEQTAYRLYKQYGAAGEEMSRRMLCEWGGWKYGSRVIERYVRYARRQIMSEEAEQYYASYFHYPNP